jgi:GDP-4-dehydro-6-deoxy-D-mannose reductase
VAAVPLITGAAGFAGSHLLDLVLERDGAATAWARAGGTPPPAPAHNDARVRWQHVDLLDRAALRSALAEAMPAVVYHCAGAADVGGSWTNPARPLQVNALGTHHLLTALDEIGNPCPVVVIGSALIYRQTADAMREDSPIGPSSPYARSKLAQEMTAERAAGRDVYLPRPFNHAGPRQPPTYATSSFAQQIAEIEAGQREPVLRVGNLDARRDLTDVRDTVRAYRMLVDSGRPRRPYNICSGQAHRVGDLLTMMLGMSRTAIQVSVDESRLRPSDNPIVLGDPSRVRAEVGWEARIAIERTLADLLDYWRQRVAAPQA